MKILVLNGSPHKNGNTAALTAEYVKGAKEAGNDVTQFDVSFMNIKDCMACEYCHTKGAGNCIMKDDMQQIYPFLNEAEMIVLASPIYYHNISGALKCAVDRFYAPDKPKNLKKIAMILSSGSDNVYAGAEYSLKGDFENYLGLETVGVYKFHGKEQKSEENFAMMYKAGLELK